MSKWDGQIFHDIQDGENKLTFEGKINSFFFRKTKKRTLKTRFIVITYFDGNVILLNPFQSMSSVDILLTFSLKESILIYDQKKGSNNNTFSY